MAGCVPLARPCTTARWTPRRKPSASTATAVITSKTIPTRSATLRGSSGCRGLVRPLSSRPIIPKSARTFTRCSSSCILPASAMPPRWSRWATCCWPMAPAAAAGAISLPSGWALCSFPAVPPIPSGSPPSTRPWSTVMGNTAAAAWMPIWGSSRPLPCPMPPFCVRPMAL